MGDVNYLGNTSLGKIQSWESKKAASITPISFPGKDSGKTEGIDTLGVIAYINFSGRWTGSFKDIQSNIFNIRNIADGQQISAQTLKSPFVNSVDSDGNRRQGQLGTNTTATANKLIDSNALFSTIGVQVDDLVKNLITGEVAAVDSVDSPTQLTLKAYNGGSVDIFPVAGGTGVSYAVSASMNCKVISIDARWVLPGLSWCNYQISVVQVK